MKVSWLVVGVLLWQPAEAAELKVMSFNIRYGAANDGENAWPKRQKLVAHTVQAYSPDLLGTQETLPFQAEYLQEQLPGYVYVGWSRDNSSDGEQCGIFYRRDRFQQQDAGQFWLSETPETRNSVSWDSSLPRVATWVLLTDKQTEDAPVLFVNTHFDHRGAEARRQSALLLRNWIESRPETELVVLTGDFNTGDDTEPWQTLNGSERLVDTYTKRQTRQSESHGTFHGFNGKPGTARIDWVLCSPQYRVLDAAIDRSHEGSRYPSDHFPVTAQLSRQ